MARQRRPLTPRRRPRQSRSRFTVSAILEAAARVFAEEGFDGCTTDRIAERAGVSVGSLYQYYRSKDAILVALAEEHVERSLEFIEELIDQAIRERTPLLQALRRLVRAAMEEQEDDLGALHRVLPEMGPLPEALAAQLEQRHERAIAQVLRLISASDEVRVRDKECAAYLAFWTVDDTIHRQLIHRFPASQAAIVENLVAMLYAYLTAEGARPPASPPAPGQPDGS